MAERLFVLWQRGWWLLPLLVLGLASRDNLGFELVADARFLIESNADVREPSGVWSALTEDYFHSSAGNRIPYYRPWTRLAWWLEAQVFGVRAPMFHAFQIAWFGLAVLALSCLCRLLGASRIRASLAGTMLALHPAAAEPLCLVMARSDVMACAAALSMLYALEAADRAPALAGRWRGLALVALVVALGSKETALLLGPLWALRAAVAHHGSEIQPVAAAALARALRVGLQSSAPALVACALFVVARRAVLGESAGVDLDLSPARWLLSLGAYAEAAVPLRLHTGLRNLAPAEAGSLAPWLRAALALCAIAACARLALQRRQAGALVLLAYGLAALLPVVLARELNVPGAEERWPLADRWALPLAAATSGLLVWAPAPEGAAPVGALRAMAGRALIGALLAWALLAAWVAPEVRAVYRDEIGLLTLEDRGYLATPPALRSAADHCRAADRAVVRAIAAKDWPAVLAATEGGADCPEPVLRGFNRLSALDALGQHPHARKVAEALLATPRADSRHLPPLHHLHGRALLHTGAPALAIEAFAKAEQLGLRSCRLWLDRAEALAALDQRPAAEAALMQARRCAGLPAGPPTAD